MRISTDMDLDELAALMGESWSINRAHTVPSREEAEHLRAVLVRDHMEQSTDDIPGSRWHLLCCMVEENEQRTIDDNHAFCEKHGIEIHVVDEVYTEKQDGSPIPPEELSLFFVAASAKAYDRAAIEAIPLAATVAEAEALAIKHLDLQ